MTRNLPVLGLIRNGLVFVWTSIIPHSPHLLFCVRIVVSCLACRVLISTLHSQYRNPLRSHHLYTPLATLCPNHYLLSSLVELSSPGRCIHSTAIHNGHIGRTQRTLLHSPSPRQVPPLLLALHVFFPIHGSSCYGPCFWGRKS
ncbi:hypothetical protein DFJ58DRAFT_811362 [Suillus subalutaceus]|uniref:uncharacterized protein n=1 Tax=Suillus subalutaceus TaxID=48586 RepID=UPI001B87D05E|nr:uncharacterized protein DFJ58DRAFT_811362 [Suillus subalutaceus]KAG1839996.1 hypothetical protein DFJ58DRAFT_811362 [Suillus subalutaceus]